MSLYWLILSLLITNLMAYRIGKDVGDKKGYEKALKDISDYIGG